MPIEDKVGAVDWVAPNVAYIEVYGALDKETMQALATAVLESMRQEGITGEIGVISDLGEQKMVNSAGSLNEVSQYLKDDAQGKIYAENLKATAVISSDNRLAAFFISVLSQAIGTKTKVISRTGDKDTDIDFGVEFIGAFLPAARSE